MTFEIVMCKKADYDMFTEGKMLLTDEGKLIPITDELREERKKIFLDWLENTNNIVVRNVKEDLAARADDDEYVTDYTGLLYRYGIDTFIYGLIFGLSCGPGITVGEYAVKTTPYEKFFRTEDDCVAFGYYGQDY